jgi:hypothetical protein
MSRDLIRESQARRLIGRNVPLLAQGCEGTKTNPDPGDTETSLLKLLFNKFGSLQPSVVSLRAGGRHNDRRQMTLARVWIKPSCSTSRPPLAVANLWRKRGFGVEVHLGQSGEAGDFRNADTSFLITPTGSCGEQNRAFRIFDLD